jgi:nucleoid-associated protein YgaU
MVEFVVGRRVLAGDTVRTIAKEVYGDVEKWQKIYKANIGVIGANPEALQPGQVLEIPD